MGGARRTGLGRGGAADLPLLHGAPRPGDHQQRSRSPGLELHGCIFYNNGWQDADRAHGHHVCLQNYEGTKILRDNLLFNAFGFGLHLYSDTDARYVQGFELEGNTFDGTVEGLDPGFYPSNDYLDAAPAANHVVVRDNAYDPGRAHVIVSNWEGLDAVAVDLDGVLAPGAVFELRHAMDLSAAPVVQAVFDGSPVSVPMTDLPVAQPIGEAGQHEP